MNWNLPHEGITLFQEIFVPICGLLALRAGLRTWAGRTSRTSGFLALLLWSAAAVAIAAPDLTSFVAKKLGINRGADLVLYLSILGGLSVCFYFYQYSRQMENLITQLMRREALRGAKIGGKTVDETVSIR